MRIRFTFPWFNISDIVFSMFWWLQLACPTMKWLWNFCKEWDNFGISYISTNAGFRPSAVVISSLDMILLVAAFKCEWMALHKYFQIGHMIDIKRLWNNIYCSFALFHTATVCQKGTQYQRTLTQQQGTQQQGSDGRFVSKSSHQIPNFNTCFPVCAHLWCLQSRDSQLRFNSHTVPRWSKYPILTLISDETQLLMTDFQPAPEKPFAPCNRRWEHLLKRTCADNETKKLSFKCGPRSWMICFLLRPF